MQEAKQRAVDNLAARRKQVHDVVHAAASKQRQLTGDSYRCEAQPASASVLVTSPVDLVSCHLSPGRARMMGGSIAMRLNPDSLKLRVKAALL